MMGAVVFCLSVCLICIGPCGFYEGGHLLYLLHFYDIRILSYFLHKSAFYILYSHFVPCALVRQCLASLCFYMMCTEPYGSHTPRAFTEH